MRTVPIRRVANQHNLFMGGDRELVLLTGLVSFALIVMSQDWLATLFGIVLWFVLLQVFRVMAKADPKMRPVYLRHITYKPYYPARSKPFRINTPLQQRQYR